MAQRPSLARLRRIWIAFTIALLPLAVLATTGGERPSTLPAALPVALVLAAGAGAVIAIVAIRRGLALHSPADDDEAIAELHGRQAMSIAIGLAPVLLAAALAAVFGHRASLLAAVAAGAAAVVSGMPTHTSLERVDDAWRTRGIDASLLRALRGDTPR